MKGIFASTAVFQTLFAVFITFFSPKLHAQCNGTVLGIAATTPSQAGTVGTWTVPSGGPYKVRVTAKGGKGGNGSPGGNNILGGKGATIIGDFLVSGGQTLQAIAGAAGGNDNSSIGGGGGGGGTGVRFSTGEVLIIAGGGGGSSYFGFGNGATTTGNGNGGTGNSGGSGSAAGGGLLSSGSNGGTNGTGTPPTGGGGGYNATGGIARNNGSLGGAGGGGFGGGGGANTSSGGGGGGYSGGNGVFSGSASFGGSSINYGSNQANTAGDNNGGGTLTIECFGSATFTASISPTQPACGSTQGSLAIDLTGDNDGNISQSEYAIVSGSSFTGTPAFNIITTDPLSVSSGFGTTGAVGGNTYTVRVRLKYNPAIYTDQTYTLNATTIPGDPAIFGNNTWNVYAWNAGGSTFTGNTNCWTTNYVGYYTDNSLDINTENNWNQNASPSSASNYAGCPVQVDNMSFAARRQGFTCGYYQLDIPGHDDGAQLWVNGTMVWIQDDYNPGTIANVWTGWLGANDKVELKVTEGTGGAFGKLHFNALAANNGDPAVFGNNTWNVYAYNSGNGTIAGTDWNTNYAGYYTSSSQDVNTENDWGKYTSPSYAANYTGCSVANDYHSYSAKRQGFNCGFYSLDVPGHDDAAQLFVNGSKVWEHDGCCDAHTGVWSGWLTPGDKVEFRITDGTVDSYGQLTFNLIRGADTSSTIASICPGQLPYSWNGNSYTSGGTYYAHFINAKGCDSVASLILTVKQTSGSETTVSICNKYTWNGTEYKASGDYTWHGTNASGCDSAATLHLTILSVTSTYVKTDVSCYGNNNGSIAISPAYGVSPFTYRIGTTGSYGNSNTFTNLKPGKYRVSILDANGCAGVSDQVTIVQSSAIGVSISKADVKCYQKADGSITANGTGGTQPYQYRFGTAGTFGSIHQWTGLAPGNYSVLVKDANGCTAAASISITQPANAVSATFTKTDESCPNAKNGSITINPTGGISPYKYRFGTTGSFVTVNTFSNLKTGNYRVFVNDANNCTGYSVGIAIGQTYPACNISPIAKATKPVTDIPATKTLEVSLSPNPLVGSFNLVVHAAKNEAVQVRVMDVNGRILYTTKGLPQQPFKFGDQLAIGIYVVEVKQDDEVKIVKAVKVR